MAEGAWQATASGTITTTATISPPAAAVNAGLQLRLRSAQFTVESANGALGTIRVRDVPPLPAQPTSLVRTFLEVLAGTGAAMAAGNLDLRASPGNALVVDINIPNDNTAIATVNIQGDLVPAGYSQGAN